MENFENDAYHRLLPDPYSWQLVEFTYRAHPTDLLKAYIDLVFARDGMERRLRFMAPQEVELSRGQMGAWCRVYVADVTARQLEGIGVRVGTLEPDWCVPSFWAASVVEVIE